MAWTGPENLSLWRRRCPKAPPWRCQDTRAWWVAEEQSMEISGCLDLGRYQATQLEGMHGAEHHVHCVAGFLIWEDPLCLHPL